MIIVSTSAAVTPATAPPAQLPVTLWPKYPPTSERMATPIHFNASMFRSPVVGRSVSHGQPVGGLLPGRRTGVRRCVHEFLKP